MISYFSTGWQRNSKLKRVLWNLDLIHGISQNRPPKHSPNDKTWNLEMIFFWAPNPLHQKKRLKKNPKENNLKITVVSSWSHSNPQGPPWTHNGIFVLQKLRPLSCGFCWILGIFSPFWAQGSTKNGHGQSHDCQVSNVKGWEVDVLLFHFDANATMSFWNHPFNRDMKWQHSNSLQCVAGNALINPASVGGTCLSNQHDVQKREINFPNVQPA